MDFVKNCNHRMKIAKSKYVLLLNSDCLVSKNAIEKMINAMKKDKKIGLLCPISSKAANLSYSIPEGFNYQSLNELFGKVFKGKTFDACTVVGNCLMISKKCIDNVGYFDEIFEKGYTEETDYQFKAMEKGFKAKVLIDTYVFHECRVSFGESEKQLKIRQEHLDIFFNRWGESYYTLLEEYKKNDPIEYINKKIEGYLKTYKNYVQKMDCINDEILKYINFSIISGQNIIIGMNINDVKEKEIMLFAPINM